MNTKPIITTLTTIFVLFIFANKVYAHGPHPQISINKSKISANKSKISSLDRKTDRRFNETSDAINVTSNEIIEAIVKTGAEELSGAKKISDATIKSLQTLNQSFEQMLKGVFAAEITKEGAVQFGKESMPGRLERDVKDKTNIQMGEIKNRTFSKKIDDYLKRVDGINLRNLGIKITEMNKDLESSGFNTTGLSSIYASGERRGEYLSTAHFSQIGTLIYKATKKERPTVIPKNVLKTNEGIENKSQLDTLVSKQNLHAKILTGLFSKSVKNNEEGSVFEVLRESIFDRYYTSGQELKEKNYVAVLRSIYETSATTNLVLIKILKEMRTQSLLMTLSSAKSANADMIVLNNKIKQVKNK